MQQPAARSLRELAAEAVTLAGSVPSYEGVYLLSSKVARVVLAVRHPRDRARAIALLTTLGDDGAVWVLEPETAERFGNAITLTTEELSAAKLRCDARQIRWKYEPNDSPAPRAILLLTKQPLDAHTLHARSSVPVRIVAACTVDEAMRIAEHVVFPHVLVIDDDLDFSYDIVNRLRDRFADAAQHVLLHWYQSSRGMRPQDAFRILTRKPSTPVVEAPPHKVERNKEVVRIVVVSAATDLVAEIMAAAPNARIEHARDGWEALELFAASECELVILDTPADDDSQPRAPWLVRTAARMVPPPAVLVVGDAPASGRVAHRFVTRPITRDLLARALHGHQTR